MRALRWYNTLPKELHTMKPGPEGCKKRIDMDGEYKDGGKKSSVVQSQEILDKKNMEKHGEHGFYTSTEQEIVAGYKDLSVAGYEDLFYRRSMLVISTQEKVWIEDQMKREDSSFW